MCDQTCADVEYGADDDVRQETEGGLQCRKVLDVLEEEGREPFHDIEDGPR